MQDRYTTCRWNGEMPTLVGVLSVYCFQGLVFWKQGNHASGALDVGMVSTLETTMPDNRVATGYRSFIALSYTSITFFLLELSSYYS